MNARGSSCRRSLFAFVVFIAATGARPAIAEDLFEKCHLLCTNEAGRTTYFTPDEANDRQWAFRLDVVTIQPFGGYESKVYVPMRPGARALAIEALPTLTWFPARDWAVSTSFPQEWNRSTGVVLPTLHPAIGSRGEIAPGRISLEVARRIEMRGAHPWIGFGYGLSDPIGTAAVRDNIDAFPDLGLEALGVGTDDIFTTATWTATPERSALSVVIGTELRIHTLPRFDRLYGATAAYRVVVEKSVASRLAIGMRFSGFRTEVFSQGRAQMNALILTPTARIRTGSATSLTLGVGAEVPGTLLNENSLQTLSTHLGFETRL